MLDKSEIRIEELNDTYYRIAELIEIDDTFRLAKAFAGRVMSINKRGHLNDDMSEIIDCVGEAKARKLFKGFLGERVYFASMKSALKAQLHHRIREEFKGYNIRELSKRYGYTERNIRRIIGTKRIGVKSRGVQKCQKGAAMEK